MSNTFKHCHLAIFLIACLNLTIVFILIHYSENDLSNFCQSQNQLQKHFCHYTSNSNNYEINNSSVINEELNFIAKRSLCSEKISIKNTQFRVKKYLIFECLKPICGGWADRLKGIMSAYMWSLFTKRKFLIDIQHPCDLTNMLEVNELDWNSSIRCLDELEIVYLNKVSNSQFHQLLQYNDIKTYKPHADVIVIRNNLDWIKSFSYNKNLYNDIMQLGYTPERFKLAYLFRELYSKLFKLTPRLMKKYNEFQQRAKPNNQTKLICAQVRIGGKRPNVEFDKQFTDRNNSNLYWEFIKNNFLKNLSSDYRIFVTTDTESVEKEAVIEFGNYTIVGNSGPFTHMDREQIISKSNCERVERAILDFHSLQLCDMAVISKSGFGMLGILNREDPVKDLYRFESTNNSFIFRKIDDLNIFNE